MTVLDLGGGDGQWSQLRSLCPHHPKAAPATDSRQRGCLPLDTFTEKGVGLCAMIWRSLSVHVFCGPGTW